MVSVGDDVPHTKLPMLGEKHTEEFSKKIEKFDSEIAKIRI